jgi:hypothetical protein
MTEEDFGPLLRALVATESDLKANAPLPPPETMTSTDALAALEIAQAKASAILAWLVAHPGAYWAARRMLTAVAALPARLRPSWAKEALAALTALPGALATANIWLPRLVGFLKATQPAPIGIPGGLDGARGHVGGGSQDGAPQTPAVDNPSGAIGGDDPNRGQ